MNRQTILFDLDDTLVHCNKYFNFVISSFAKQLEHWFSCEQINQDYIKQKQLEIDMISINKHGFQVDRFPQSLINTYHYFSEQTGRETDVKDIQWLRNLGYSVFDQDYELYPAATETLIQLKEQGHQLCLYTGGEDDVQMRKVENAGLQTYFEDRIFITQHKTLDVLEDIIKAKRFNRNLTWMIGNSARTDILPAIKAGIHAIHIPIPYDWEFNQAEINIRPKGVFYKLSSINQVVDVFSKKTNPK